MARLAQRLRADARGFGLRFLGWFSVLTLGWAVLAPGYAAALAAAAGVFAPVLEPGTEYVADGPKVVAVRPLPAESDGRRRHARMGLWSAEFTWSSTLFLAAVLATPGWSWPGRGRAAALGAGALAASQLVHVLVNAGYTRTRLVPGTPEAVATGLQWLSGFFDIILAGVLPVGLYLLLASGERGATRAPVSDAGGAPRRNASCPCGSGEKYKRCCGAG